MAHYAPALDVGGTFTDVMLMHRESGRFWTVKTPSTPADASEGFFQGIQKMLSLAGIAPETIDHVLHGSTVATNTILEGKGANTSMLTTEGFKYVLEIGRHNIPRRANLYAWVKPTRPVPPRRILEVRERVLLDGTVDTPLDEAGCRDMARRLRAMGVEAVAAGAIPSTGRQSKCGRTCSMALSLPRVRSRTTVSCSIRRAWRLTRSKQRNSAKIVAVS
jgi:N-methylhydantoinase A